MTNQVPIGAVERDTGIPKDTLRVWERRYGFPQPGRNAQGERVYPADQVATLRLVKQLVDLGHRPKRVVGQRPDALRRLLAQAGGDAGDDLAGAAAEALAQLLAEQSEPLRETLRGLLLRHGLERFVCADLPPLVEAIGEAWSQGRLAIHHEHLFSDQVERLLTQAIGQLPMQRGQVPILLATLPGEQHRLGLRMVEALCATRGRPCLSLGTDLPVDEIARAAVAHGAGCVALSISNAAPVAATARAVADLQAALPSRIPLWLGGGGAPRLRPRPPATRVFNRLEELLLQLDHD
ncbi:MAG TPA: MerR family transcriptional regulator [Gammaproteobacteria bacterium]